MVNLKHKTTEDMINQLQHLKGKTIVKYNQKISNYYDERKYRRQSGYSLIEEDPFAKHAQGIAKIFHEVLLLKKFLQTKPQVKNMKTNYYDFDYIVIINLIEEKNEISDKSFQAFYSQ